MNYKNWTIEEELELEKLINQNILSYKKIGRLLNRTSESCRSHANVLGLKNNFLKRKYDLNDNFWKDFTSKTCYWAGFSAADASIMLNSNVGSLFRLELSIKDLEHLKQFLKEIESNNPIKISKRISETVGVQISSRVWHLDLEKNFNIVPNKVRRLKPINIKNNFLELCWLIGYTDGDGTIYLNKRINQVIINYVSACKEIIYYIKELIDKNFNTKLRNRVSNVLNYNNYSSFTISGIRACIIIDYLRKFDIYKMDRKWNNPIILDYIDNKKKKYPELFID